MTQPIDRASRPARRVDDGKPDETPEPLPLSGKNEPDDSEGAAHPEPPPEPPWWHVFRGRVDELDDPSIARALLLAATALVVVTAADIWGPWSMLGNDASSHITTIATFAERLASGDGWWSDDYNLGFPLGLYYQPLPHMVSGAVCAILGGPERAVFTYKLLLTLMIALQPWTVYLGLRRAGGDHLTSGLAGLMSVLVMNSFDFGYTTHASLTIGLYTQAWGNTALPLALGELVRLCRGQGRVSTTIAAASLLASCHMFYAIALVPPIAALAPLFVLSAPPDSLHADDAPPLWERIGMAYVRLGLAGLGAFLVLSAWLVPLSSTQAFFGGWPFGRETRVDGYGWWYVQAALLDGSALDGDNRFGDVWLPALRASMGGDPFEAPINAAGWWRIPVLTFFAWVGALAAFVRRRGDPVVMLGLALAAWSAVCVAGRASFGGIIDAYPLHASVQLFRYAALLQFALVIVAAWGLSTLAEGCARLLSATTGIVVIAIALVAPIAAGAGQMDTGFNTIDRSVHLDTDSYTELSEALRRAPLEGRMLVGPDTGTPGHFHGGLLSWVGQRPAGQSYGVGLHDSLGFYYLEFFNPQSDNAMSLADLYDFRIMVSSPSHDMRGLRDARTLWQNGRYRISLLPVSATSIAVMREGETQRGTPRSQRTEIRRWLNGNGPEVGTTVVLEVDDPRSRADLVGAPVTVSGERTWPDTSPPGEVVTSGAVANVVSGEVELSEPGLVVFKVGYHPFWRVTVDDERVDTVYAYPCYLAARVGPGTHRVRAEFRWPGYTRVLLALAPLTLLAAWGIERWLLAALALRLRRTRRAS